MESIVLRRTDWDELEGKWQALVMENYHEAYNGMGECYSNVTTAEAKIENMKPFVLGLPAWGAWQGPRLVGLIMGKISGERLVLYDLFVSRNFRRRRIGQRLVEMAIKESGARLVGAEINHDNAASQALFKSLAFTVRHRSDWVELDLEEGKGGSQ